jgi:signal transduction histidine kinase
MSSSALPRLALPAAAFLAALLVSLATMSIYTTGAFLDEARQVAASHQALHAVDALENSLREAEDANRGYLLTSQDEYLDAYHKAEAAVGEAYGRLAAVRGGRDAKIDPLHEVIDARLAHLRQGLTLMAHDPPHALVFIRQGEGKELMDRALRAISDLRTSELAQLDRDEADARLLATRCETLDWAGGAMGLAAIAVGVAALRSEWRRRAAAEVAVREANAKLELQVRERTAALVRANERLEDQTRELRNANDELESFSSIVSHDLRAPLRIIEGMARMVLKRDAERVGSESRRDLDLLMDNSHKMRDLIDDLLSFSRLGRRAPDSALVDTRGLVEACWGALTTEREGRVVELRLGELPPCRGDAPLVRQVLMNVLGNAVKYTRPRERAQIEISGAPHEGQVRYQVRDNGVGFDMAYAPKLFGIFSRLHSDDQFEGTGIGLAIVRRIVERHGGRVWAESQVGVGTTMSFTLPAA